MAFTFERNKDISDIILIQPRVFGDERGFFMETYNQKDFSENGISTTFIQDNHSKSSKGIFRGFHFQTKNTQSKIVRVLHGAVLDFAVDIRKTSETYGRYIMELLSAENKKQLFVPKGFAHGFIALEDGTEFAYKCDDLYNPNAEGGIIYDDRDINIPWENIISTHKIDSMLLSEKDKKNMTFQEFDKINPFI